VAGLRSELEVHVSAGARRPGIVGRHGHAWKVRIAAPPERGRANDALLDLLATALRLPRRSVALVKGRTRRDKVVALEGLTPAEAEARLAAAAGDRR
jgi:uncharacterized protein (TIGR00251 family)